VPYRSVNPATGEVLMTFPEHTDQQMWSALAAADKAFRGWAARPFSERSRIIGRSAQYFSRRKKNSLAFPSCHSCEALRFWKGLSSLALKSL
jgi:succinate-semialdehyde dehydrogenase / glutarate-semialdehyde dehydrogenase